MPRSIIRFLVPVAATLLAGGLANAQWSHQEGAPAPKAGGVLVQPFTRAQWQASNFAAPEDLRWFRDAKYGMFIHFGLSTHDNQELSWGTCRTRKAPDQGNGPVADEVWQSWPKDFRIERFDAKEWVAIAQEAGFKYLVVIAKHHDGFHLWDTALSDFKVTNTPYGKDYLKELSEACHAAGMPFGVYYSQRDWHHPDYQPRGFGEGGKEPGPRHPDYIRYQKEAVRELLTKYGKIDILWWDAAYWGGMFVPEDWDAEALTREARRLQPHLLMNNRCSVPGDFDTPEQRLGFFQDWRPWESCLCLEKTWSYSGNPPKAFDQLVNMLVQNACNDGNTLLSWGPKWNGAFAEDQKQRLIEVGAWLKKNGAAIYGTRGGPWTGAGWGGSTRRGDTVYLHVQRLQGETLSLPELPGRTLVSARLLNGGGIEVRRTGNGFQLPLPASSRDSLDTIVELKFDGSVENLPAIPLTNAASMFAGDEATYGKVVTGGMTVKTSSTSPHDPRRAAELASRDGVEPFAFHTDVEREPWVELDLGRTMTVTGLVVTNRTDQLQDRAATLTLRASIDGKAWEDVWKAGKTQDRWEIPVTRAEAGAQVPGRTARYLRLGIHPSQPTPLHLSRVEVWAK